ncbi:MAG: hypothetical protein IT353_07375 [Gemmatimonadaceae bacterium]|nr:hypothetical protein [Gemmatimonadaceae bacterium]
MRLRIAFCLAFIVLGCDASQKSDRTTGSAPEGMSPLDAGGSGQVFTVTLAGGASASVTTQELLQRLQPYFGGTARVLHAIGDPSGSQIQASFSAMRGGTRVMGLLAIRADNNTARAVVLFDEARSLSGSIDRLLQVAMNDVGGGGARTAVVATVALTRTPIPDGSGTIDLGPGWIIRHAYQGAIDVQGPLPGSGMSLGAVMPVPFTSSDPTEALVMMSQATSRSTGRDVSVTVIDSRPMEWAQGGRAALIRYFAHVDGKRMDYFGLIGITPYDGNQVFLYTSYIQAPQQSFAEVFPTAMRSWATWSISSSVLAQRMQQSASTMRETGDLLASSNRTAQRSFEGVNEGWGQYVRGVATLEDPDRNRSEVDQSFADLVVRANPNQFRIVPTSELIR